MVEHLRKLPTDIDMVKTIITSPLLGVVTYSLDDCFTILAVHCQRHFGQAKRVTEPGDFQYDGRSVITMQLGKK